MFCVNIPHCSNLITVLGMLSCSASMLDALLPRLLISHHIFGDTSRIFLQKVPPLEETKCWGEKLDDQPD